LEITLTKKDETYGSIVIDLQSSDVTPKFEAKLKDYSKQVQLKGFRPGKVPPGIVNKMYGESIKAEVVTDMLNKSLSNYISEEKLSILGEPLPSEEDKDKKIDWKKDVEFKFTYDVGLTPEFKYDISNKVKMTKLEVETDENDISEALENIRRQHGEREDVEVSAENDILQGKLIQEKTEYSKDCSLSLDKVNPKVVEKLIGLKAGDTVTLDLKKTFNKDYEQISILTGVTEAEAKKLKGDYNFTVASITRVTPAELNQELYDKLFGKDVVKTEEELNEKIKEVISKNYSDLSEQHLLKELKSRIIEKTKFSLPEDFLKRWLIATNAETLNKEEIEKDFDNYRESFKWNIISNRIFSDAELSVEREEVKERASSFIQQSYFGGMPIGPEFAPMFDEFVGKFLAEENGKNFMNIYHQLLEEKVLLHAKEGVTIKTKEVKSKEFKDLLNKEG